MYWGFVYDIQKDTITLGPYVIQVDIAVRAAVALADDIYQAAHAVDQRAAAELRIQTAHALTAAGLPWDSAGDVIKVSRGHDTRVWLSMATTAARQDHRTLSEEVIAALAVAGLQLLSFAEPQSTNPAERLRTGEALYVAPVDAQR